MEGILKKYQQKFRKVREEMDRWEDLQSRLMSQFSNASSIIGRLQMIGDKKNYGSLKGVNGVEDAVLQKQMESLETILLSIKKTVEDFHSIVLSLEKMVRDSKQLVQGGSHQRSTKQLQQRVGLKPSLSDCLDGLAILLEMHNSEYLLKSSVVSALLNIALKPSSKDLGALRQLLFDQPNIPRDEVQFIYDIIFAEDIC
ncbi:hypothetical protein SOVF_142870 [Spinacia oleracea]|uniref:Uncharacterized protein At5g43822 n=1 Tax=Spinacia oleracea TaxID=3562 RepID=A0A9R0J031_SPIOL|nr:uncharacterized protein At5g43822 [Spinacia oleracea]KNA10594.1 hypothetical protein SOVF_142870 [Spinacia oleracea]